MHATLETRSPPRAGPAAAALGLLRAAVRDAVGGVVVVDADDAMRIVYANDSFLALAQLPAGPAEDLRIGDAVGLGPALEGAIVACRDGDGFFRQRAAVPQGGGLHPVFVSVERYEAERGWYVLVIRDAGDDAPEEREEDAATRFARAARATGEGYWDWNLLTGAAWFGPNFAQVLGIPEDELGRSFAEFRERVHQDDRIRLLQAIRLHVEQRQPFDVEVRIRTGATAWHAFRLRGSASRDGSGRPTQLSGRIEDVEQRRRAERHRRTGEDFLRRTLDGLDVAVGVLNSKGEIVEINGRWREYDGDRALIGLRYGFGENYARLCRAASERCEQGPAAADGLEQVLNGERSAFSISYRVPRDEGEHRLQLRAQAFEVAGQRGVIVVHDDVSALHAAEQAARAAEQFNDLILDSVPLHIAYVNRSRELVYANRSYEEWFRLPLAALAGRRLEQLTSADDYRQIAPRVESVLGGREVEFPTRVRRGDEERELIVTYLPHVVDGETLGFFSVARDVTQQKRLEAELRHAQKMEAVGQLTGGLAHDFNNLLSVVIGNLQLLERPLKGDARLGGHVATALRAALRGADITRRLLAFSRQQVLEPRVTAPNRVLAGMHELVRRTLGAAIEFETDLAADAWSVYVDVGQLENSLLNLIINARDAMPDGGRVTVATRNVVFADDDPARHAKLKAGEYVEVAVRDTGGGMAADVAKRAFEPFFTTKDVGKGTGLGLSMVYGFAEQSGGIATITSDVGRGTRVSLYFPRSHLAVAGAHEGESVATDLPHGTEAVLVVEGDADVRATAVSSLRLLGYRVLEAGTGDEALERLAGAPDACLLLTETTLPGGMPGVELAERANARLPHLRVLYTPGFAGGVRLRGLPTGADVLPKPYAIGELARRIRAALDKEKSDGF